MLDEHIGAIGCDARGIRFAVPAEDDSYNLKGAEVVILGWHATTRVPFPLGSIQHISKLTPPFYMNNGGSSTMVDTYE